jgi:hypothetical protein
VHSNGVMTTEKTLTSGLRRQSDPAPEEAAGVAQGGVGNCPRNGSQFLIQLTKG